MVFDLFDHFHQSHVLWELPEHAVMLHTLPGPGMRYGAEVMIEREAAEPER